MNEGTITILVTILVGLLAFFGIFIQQQQGKKTPAWVKVGAAACFLSLLVLALVAVMRASAPPEATANSSTSQPIMSASAITLPGETSILPSATVETTALPSANAVTVETTALPSANAVTNVPFVQAATDTPPATVPAATETSASAAEIVPSEDIPGPVVPSGFHSKRVIDGETRPRDVYTIQMKAGQQAKILVKSSYEAFVAFAVPGKSSFDGQGNELCRYSTTCDKSFFAAVDGEYHIAVSTRQPSISYDFSVVVLDKITMSERSDDIPGSALPPSGKVESVIDANTKKRDVYSIQMKAGQQAKILVKSSYEAFVAFAVPGKSSFDGQGNELCRYSTTCDKSFFAAVDGEYYIAISTRQPSIAYNLSVIVSDSITMSDRGEDIPGAVLPASGRVESVIDADTKKRDVYSIQMKAGQEAKILVKSSYEAFITFAGPGTSSFDGQGNDLCRYSTTCEKSFRAAVDGEYYIAVSTRQPSISYKLIVSVN